MKRLGNGRADRERERYGGGQSRNFYSGIFIPGGILRDGVPAAPTNRVRWNIAGITRRDHDHEHEQIDEPVIDATPVARDICGELKIATLNITDGRNSRLNGALRCMKQMEVDIGHQGSFGLHGGRNTHGR